MRPLDFSRISVARTPVKTTGLSFSRGDQARYRSLESTVSDMVGAALQAN